SRRRATRRPARRRRAAQRPAPTRRPGLPAGARPSPSAATVPSRPTPLRKRDGSAALDGRTRRYCVAWARPAGLVQVAQPTPEAVDLALDLRRGLAVALRAARHAVELHRLAPGDRDRRESPELPALRAVHRTADD